MGITVSDIEQKEFAFKGPGYDPYDVDSYLDQICDEMIAMQDRIDALQAELKQTKAALEASQEAVRPIPQEVNREVVPAPIVKTSETLENILLSAQRISDEAIESAKKRAEEILADAQRKAGEITDNAQEEKLTLEKELASLKSAAGEFKKRFVSMLEEHKALLDTNQKLFDHENGGEENGEFASEAIDMPVAMKKNRK
ncbi:MAG: DivIVA domain-containing protein [Clostridiales bacterium]|nr:DivIVA domain-containing protein [Clostridiales bacterium]